MILFDIHSLPNGVDINVWYSLYEKGLCIYDSLGAGLKPEKVEADGVAFIDINSMDPAERTLMTNAINAILDDRHKKQDEINATVRENNKQLIEYLKNINNK